MPNPFYEAQASAGQDPSQAPMPQGQLPGGGGVPYPDPMQGVPQQGAYADELGGLRDSIMQQFPDVMAPDEPPAEMDSAQKLTMFGLFLANPQGAADMVRQRREAQAKRQALRAELALKATGVAGEVLKAQSESQRAILEMHLAVNKDWQERKQQEFNEHIQRGQLALQQATAGLAGRRYADQQQFQQGVVQDMHSGVDAGGNPISTPGMGAGADGRVSTTIGTGGISQTISPPRPPRDQSVDFDSWLKARFGGPMGSIQLKGLSTEQLVAMYQKERQALSTIQPGTMGAASGVPIGGPGLSFDDTGAGYDDPSGDAIESYSR